jgi:hypothetical protein
MAADQRYCIECGERRGDSRLSNLEEAVVTQPHATPTPAVTSYAPPSAPRGRSQGLALIATIGLLLLSMGVGVLIGNKGGNSTSGVAQQPIVLGAASPTVATGATSATTASSSKDAEAEAAAAAGDSGGADADAVAKKNGVKLAPKDAKVGDKCESGAVGCDGGKFTGDYFGGD